MDPREVGAAVDLAISLYHTGASWGRVTLPPEARRKVELYCADPRNVVDAGSIQARVSFAVGGLHYFGIIDQSRDGAPWEIKYSKLPPRELVEEYLVQLLLYAYALRAPIGGIINVRNYGTSRPVFHVVKYTPNSLDVAKINALIRRGK